jgi:hypothetical protein
MNKKHSPVKINRAETKSYKDNMPENNKNNFLPFNLPFASFTYKSMSISYDGKDTHVKARNVSMENNELKDEKLEGIVPGADAFNEAFKIQTNMIKSFISAFNPFSYIPSGFKDKKK